MGTVAEIVSSIVHVRYTEWMHAHPSSPRTHRNPNPKKKFVTSDQAIRLITEEVESYDDVYHAGFLVLSTSIENPRLCLKYDLYELSKTHTRAVRDYIRKHDPVLDDEHWMLAKMGYIMIFYEYIQSLCSGSTLVAMRRAGTLDLDGRVGDLMTIRDKLCETYEKLQSREAAHDLSSSIGLAGKTALADEASVRLPWRGARYDLLPIVYSHWQSKHDGRSIVTRVPPCVPERIPTVTPLQSFYQLCDSIDAPVPTGLLRHILQCSQGIVNENVNIDSVKNGAVDVLVPKSRISLAEHSVRCAVLRETTSFLNSALLDPDTFSVEIDKLSKKHIKLSVAAHASPWKGAKIKRRRNQRKHYSVGNIYHTLPHDAVIDSRTGLPLANPARRKSRARKQSQ